MNDRICFKIDTRGAAGMFLLKYCGGSAGGDAQGALQELLDYYYRMGWNECADYAKQHAEESGTDQ